MAFNSDKANDFDLESKNLTTKSKVAETSFIAAKSGSSELTLAEVLSQDFLNAGYLRHLLLKQPQESQSQAYSLDKLQKLVQTEQNNLKFCNGELYADHELLDVQKMNYEERNALVSYKNKLDNIMRQTFACSVVENNVADQVQLKIAMYKSKILHKLHYLESSGLLFKILNESVDGKQVFLINVRPRSFSSFINQYRAWRELHPALSKYKK